MIDRAPTGFYVYTLFDPSDGAVFYVGKGQADRAWQHEAEVRRGRVCNQKKTARIQAILNDGFRVGISIVAEYDVESDAYEHEIELISSLSGLSNILAGGDGPIFNLTAEQIAARVLARAERIRIRREEAVASAGGGQQLRKAQAFIESAHRAKADVTSAALWWMQNERSFKANQTSTKRGKIDLANFRASRPH